MRKGTKIVAGLVAAPLLLGSVTACNKDTSAKEASAKAAGSDGKDAKTRLMDAAKKTGDTDKLRISAKLGVDNETLDIMQQDSSSKMKDKEKKLVTDSSLVIDEQSTGGKLSEEKDQSKVNVSMAWKTDSKLVEMVTAGGKAVYLKADLPKIAQQTGAFDYSRMKSQIPASMPGWITDFVAGKYIGFDVATLQEIVKATGQKMPDMTTATANADQQKQMQDALQKNADTNVTYTGDGDTIKGAVKLKPFVKQFVADARRIAPQQFTAAQASQLTKSLDGLKDDAVVNADFTLADDKLKTITFDIMQVVEQQKNLSAKDKKLVDRMKAKGKTFPVVMDMSEPDGDVKAPEGARMVTKAEIEQLMGGMRRTTPTS